MKLKNIFIVVLSVLVLFLGVRLFLVQQQHNRDLKKIDKCMELFLSTSKELEEVSEEYSELLESYEALETKYQKKVSYSKEEIDLLAKCVESEAGFNDTSQKYVASVILNRVASKSFPNDINSVIYQKNGNIPQFSVAYNGKISSCTPKESTYKNVYDVLLYGEKLPSYVLYFYSDSVTENWVNTLTTYTKCGGSVFAY